MVETTYFDSLLVAGVPAVVLVPLVIELAKRLGLPSRYAPLASLLAASLVAAAAELAPTVPALLPLLRWGVATLLLSLSASGAYETVRFYRRTWAGPADQT